MIERTVLVVDDNKDILKLTGDIFEAVGYKVVTAADGQHALGVLAERQIDLVVSDILMPNTDGFLLCYTIRTHEKFRNTPVIIYSLTYTSSSDEDMAMEIGADIFIRKQAASEELITAAKFLLSDARNYVHKVPSKPKSLDATRLYNEELVNKLEMRNLELIDRKEKLEQGESRLKEAQTIAHIGSWEIDMMSNTQHWSDELFRMFGAGKDEIPSIELFLSFIHPEDVGLTTRSMERAFKTLRESSFDFRFVYERQRNTVRVFPISV